MSVPWDFGTSGVLYHGGVSGLVEGDRILAPALTGAFASDRADRVYLALELGEAAVYAAIRRGDLYAVRPLGTVWPDVEGVSVSAVRAVVVEVLERSVPVEVALVAMRRAAAGKAPA